MTLKPINYTRKIYVYRNLRRNCLSLQQSGLIVGHAEAVILQNAEFRVREFGRQRVLREKHKNVHAFTIGLLNDMGELNDILIKAPVFDPTTTHEVSYNPYRLPTFFNVKTLEPVHSGKRVLVTTNNIWVEE